MYMVMKPVKPMFVWVQGHANMVLRVMINLMRSPVLTLGRGNEPSSEECGTCQVWADVSAWRSQMALSGWC